MFFINGNLLYFQSFAITNNAAAHYFEYAPFCRCASISEDKFPEAELQGQGV